jgi:Raf kinase inhibitor-like YbhB/YbcL family protein
MKNTVSKRTIIKALFFGAAMLVVGRSSALTLSSPSFKNGGPIPLQNACKSLGGQNISPALNWSDVPAGTKSLAIVVTEYTYRGPFYHWFIGNIPPTMSGLRAGIPQGSSSHGFVQGKNDLLNNGYDGPCPPRLDPRRYYYHFKLYALNELLPDTILYYGGDFMREITLGVLQPLAKADLVGTFTNQK